MLRSAMAAFLVLTGCSVAGEPGRAGDTIETQSVQRAREVLAERLHVAMDDVKVTAVAAKTWSDSSMGCGTPGTVAATVITEGYAVSAAVQGRTHLVHVSGANALVCDKAGLVRREHPVSARGAGLDLMMQRAREDLAQRLGVDAAKIRLGGLRAEQWPDSGLGCPQAGEALTPGPVDGFLLTLRHAGRIYTYHTDRRTVRPCPAIETE